MYAKIPTFRLTNECNIFHTAFSILHSVVVKTIIFDGLITTLTT